MGIIERVLSFVFGGGRNAVAETVQVFRENAEAGAARAAQHQTQVLEQFAQEFQLQQRGWFDRLMDGLNRIPRPAMALGTLGLFVAAMVDPVWFAQRMQGIALVPEPLWWLLGAIVSFYFGARHQAKGQEFQRSLAQTMTRAPQVLENISALEALIESEEAQDIDVNPETRPAPLEPSGEPNAALEDWRRVRS